MPCFAQDNDFDVASVIVLILACGDHYFFIFIPSSKFDHFSHFGKYPNQKTIINLHISVAVC